MVEKQVGLINREREANLQNRLAQEESNREFRTEQLQNIYDFDVSGLPMPYINAMKDLQGKMAASLDPSSELSYDSSQKLIADIAQLNNLHIAGKRVTSTGSAAKKVTRIDLVTQQVLTVNILQETNKLVRLEIRLLITQGF